MMPENIKEVLVLHHTHTDLGYTHPFPVLVELQKRFIDQAIEQCEATSDWPEESRMRWTCECTWVLDQWLKSASESSMRRFKELVATGQMGAAALPFHPTPLCDTPQLARLLRPVGVLRERLGLPLRTAIGHDINGLPWPANRMLREAGVDLLIMGINIVFGGYPFRRPMAFRWESPGCGELLAFNGEHYAAFNRELRVFEHSTDRMAEGLEAYLRRAIPDDWPLDFIFLTATHPYFVDNNPPDLRTVEMIRLWNREGRQPHIRTILPEELADRLTACRSALPVGRGDWTDYWNFGCASSATETRVFLNARARLGTAEALRALRSPARRDSGQAFEQARAMLDLFTEHTWGASGSAAEPCTDRVLQQWNHKAEFAWKGLSWTQLAIRDELEAFSGNPSEGDGAEGILVVNPAPFARTAYVRIPRVWMGKGRLVEGANLEGRAAGSVRDMWRHFSSNIHKLEFDRELWPQEGTVLFGPISLPAAGGLRIPVAEVFEARPAGELRADGPVLESSAYRLVFDPEKARIVSLVDRKTGAEVVDPESPWGFFGYVQETAAGPGMDAGSRLKGREALFKFDWGPLHANISGWNPEWPAVRRTPDRLVSWESTVEADAAVLRLRYEAPGVRDLVQVVRLPAFRPVVECRASMVKDDCVTPESIYFAFPLGLEEGWRAAYDTADIPVEYDAGQLPGTSRDYVTVGRWAAIHDQGTSALLACPDAPMVQIGDFHFGRHLASVPRPKNPVLLGWVACNYWMTNFRANQPGPLKVSYEFSTSPSFDPASAVRAGMDASIPVEVHPLLRCPERTEETFYRVDQGPLVPLHVETVVDDEVIAVTLLNPTANAVSGSFYFEREPRIRAAFRSDPLNRKGSALAVRDNGFTITVEPLTSVRVLVKLEGNAQTAQ